MILVVATYRTGSHWYCENLAKEYEYECLYEYFHEHEYDHRQRLTHLHENPNSVVKIMPEHLTQTPMKNLFDELIAMAERVHFVVRRDFNAQLKSYYAAKHIPGEWHEEFSDTKEIIVGDDYRDYGNYLIHQVVAQSKLYYHDDVLDKRELHYMEDSVTHRLKRPVIFIGDLPEYAFKPENLF